MDKGKSKLAGAREDFEELEKAMEYAMKKGKQHEQEENPQEAIKAYKSTMKLIEYMRTLSHEMLDCSKEEKDGTWDAIYSKFINVCDIDKGIADRIQKLQDRYGTLTLTEKPEEIARDYMDILNDLKLKLRTRSDDIVYETIYQTAAKLYKIQSNGMAYTFEHETVVSLIKCKGSSYLDGICFLQCSIAGVEQDMEAGAAADASSIWIYPLVPLLTACYRSNRGAFIFPDMRKDRFEEAFCVLLNESSAASSIDDEFSKLLEIVLGCLKVQLESGNFQIINMLKLLELRQLMSKQIEEKNISPVGNKDASATPSKDIPSYQGFSLAVKLIFLYRSIGLIGARPVVPAVKYARAITGVASVAVSPLGQIGGLVACGISEVAPKLLNSIIDSRRRSSKDPKQRDALQKSLEAASAVSSRAAEATKCLPEKADAASRYVGHFLKPHIKAAGSEMLQNVFNYDSAEAERAMEATLIVSAGFAEAVNIVNTQVESVGRNLARALKDGTVQTIEHIYGPDASKSTANAFDTIGNAYIVHQNLSNVNPKKFVKTAANSILDQYKELLRDAPDMTDPDALVQPDISGLEGYNTGK